jgi:hypothetical protein
MRLVFKIIPNINNKLMTKMKINYLKRLKIKKIKMNTVKINLEKVHK